MDGLANGADTMECPHCGKEMRRGMIRCRECGKAITDAPGDFVLTGHALVSNPDHKCARCGTILEPGAVDCPSCTSAMLDQLMMGPPPGAEIPTPHIVSSRAPVAPAELRTPRPAPVEASPDDDPFADPEELADSPLRSRPAATATTSPSKPARKPAAPNKASGSRPGKTQAAAQSQDAGTPATAPGDKADEAATETPPVETSAACLALLASLTKADVVLRCEIAAALGKLGDKAALGPLERFMVDPEIRVRRAVAAALVQLGHPKGETLLDIAERKPAAASLAAPAAPKAKKSGGGGMNLDPGMLLKAGGGLVAALLVVGGIWWWVTAPSGPPSKGKKPSKSAAAKKTTPAPKKAGPRTRPTAE